MSERWLVLGLGNELFTDEGIGIAAARRLEERHLPGVEVLDGGTLGVGLLPAIEDRDGLVVFDAVVSEGAAPGSVLTIGSDALHQGYRLLMSAHQIGLPEVLAAAELGGHPAARVAAVGMVPVSLDTGYGVSRQGEAALDVMVDRAVAILGGWGLVDA